MNISDVTVNTGNKKIIEPSKKSSNKQMPFNPADFKPDPNASHVIRPKQPTQVKEDFPEYSKSLEVLEGFERIELPSKFIFYDFKDMQARPLTVIDLGDIHKSVVDSDFTLFIDTIGKCINRDIRSLTLGDWTFLMYWLRIESYPATPFTVQWTSKYGNSNSLSIKMSNLITNIIEMTEEEYQPYKELKLTHPTVRDLEVIHTAKLTESQKYIFSKAQFIIGNNIKDKIAKLEQCKDLTILEKIAEFSTKINHGVQEIVKVRDEKFNSKLALDYLKKQAAFLYDRGTELNNSSMIERAIKLEIEIEKINSQLAIGANYVPEEEELEFSISAKDFFI